MDSLWNSQNQSLRNLKLSTTKVFVPEQVPKQEIEEDEVVVSWLYKHESQSKTIQACDSKTPKIPSKLYGLRDKLIAKMGYLGKGTLGVWGKGLIAPIAQVGWPNKDTTSLGYSKKPFYLQGKSSHVIEQIKLEETNNEGDDNK